jgi:hypothetical protein
LRAIGYESNVTDARFFTVSDAGYFVGTVALLNSLRLTGNREDLVVLDRGFTASQRRRLEGRVVLIDGANDARVPPHAVKPFPVLLNPSGVVVVIDSDMLVTSPLSPILERAQAGKICVFPDAPADLGRWFAEWDEGFELKAPLRRQPYVNSGFVAFSPQHWPTLLRRWWDACQLIPERRATWADVQPFADHDQDAFNEILMSELPADAVELLPAYEWNVRRISVDDARTLRCSVDGDPEPLLHAWQKPKVWQGRACVRGSAYERLMPRVLFASDVEVRLAHDEVPLWLRPGRVARLASTALSARNNLPDDLRRVPRIPSRLAREARSAPRRTARMLHGRRSRKSY